MSQLKQSQRRKIPRSKFVYPDAPGGPKYPIDTEQRARSALRLSAKRNTFGSYATVAKAVFRRFPHLKRGT